MGYREGHLTGQKNLKLYYQCWLPKFPPNAVLIVVHGLADHSGRYANLVDHFIPLGYGVYAMDLRGHGKSEGLRAYVDRFSDYADDLNILVDRIKAEQGNIKIFMVGHSMGATIAVDYSVTRGRKLAGLVLSDPAMKAGTSVTKLSILMAKVLSRLVPKLGVAKLDASTISRDKAVVDAYIKDPLVYCGRIRARLGAELLDTMEHRLPLKMWKITLPVLIMYGTADKLVNPEGSKIIFEKLGSTDKTIKGYDGFYHEIFNDPERAQVFADMEAWLAKRV